MILPADGTQTLDRKMFGPFVKTKILFDKIFPLIHVYFITGHCILDSYPWFIQMRNGRTGLPVFCLSYMCENTLCQALVLSIIKRISCTVRNRSHMVTFTWTEILYLIRIITAMRLALSITSN